MVARLCKEDRLLLQEIRNGMLAEDRNLLLTGMCNTNKYIWDARNEILEELQEIKQFLEELQGLKASICKLARGAVPEHVERANGFEPCCREPVAKPQHERRPPNCQDNRPPSARQPHCRSSGEKGTPRITEEMIIGVIEEPHKPLAAVPQEPCHQQWAAEPQNEERSAEPQKPPQQDELPDFEAEEVEEWPVEPQCHEPLAKTKQEKMSMACAQPEEITKTTPQQDEVTNVEPQHCHEPATHAEQVEWRPCSAIEERYEDLSDLSSVDGNESPPHKQLKEYAAARRAARKQTVVGTSPVEPTEENDGPTRHIEPTAPEPAEQIPTKMPRLSVELVPCARQEADTATCIRQALQQQCGDDVAAAILRQYQQKVMRDRKGNPKRFLVDVTGATLKLVQQKNVTPI